MIDKKILFAATAFAGLAAPAQAQIVIDGSRDAAFGAVDSTVAFDPSAPNGNFGSPGPGNATASYTITLDVFGDNLFGSSRPIVTWAT